MYKNKKILAFIPARAGSKRLPGKNIKKLNNIPLFKYSIDIAQKSQYIDSTILSSDSIEILNIAHNLGCINNNIRPDYLSNDTARIIDVILYELKENSLNEYDVVVLLQPTFPYRDVELLDLAIEKYFDYETSLITVVKIKENPAMIRTIENGLLKKIVDWTSDIRSQDFINTYKIIGSIYINNIKLLNEETVLNENEIPFIVDNKFDIDIDTLEDFKRAETEISK